MRGLWKGITAEHRAHLGVRLNLLNAGKRPQGLAFSSQGEHGAALFPPLDRASPAGALQTQKQPIG